MKIAFYTLLLVASFIQVSIGCVTPSSQVAALNDLYTSTNGRHWKCNGNWGYGDPCNVGWCGVICDNNCNVTYLYLFSNRLVGTIPSTIGDLPYLQYLSMYNNTLRGTIPSTVGNLVYLFNFELSNTTINNLKHLDQLFWNNNQLTGTVSWPVQPEIGLVDISNNQFSCPLPTWCSPPPHGNGACAPCVKTTPRESQFLCCFYSDSGCREITFSSCEQGSACPPYGELEHCYQSVTSNCSKCYPNDGMKGTAIN